MALPTLTTRTCHWLFMGFPSRQEHTAHAEPVDLAVTLASLLGINGPTHSVGRVLTEALAPAHRAEDSGSPPGRSNPHSKPSGEVKPVDLSSVQGGER